MTEKKSLVSDELKYEDEYSRLIAALGGKEALKKIQESRVFLQGCKGLGLEIAKNLILMGIASITIHDNEKITVADLSSNFYLTVDDVGKNRAEVTVAKLKELNERVSVIVYNQDITYEVLEQFKVVVMTNSTIEEILRVNDFTHTKGTKFIAADTPGLFGYIFVDFGDEFEVLDPDGENPKTAFISHISSDEDGVVTIVEGHRHDLQDNDVIRITEVKGMNVNDKTFKVTVRGPDQLGIGDTRGLGTYESGGFTEQVKQSVINKFQPLRSFLHKELPSSKVQMIDWAKFELPNLYFLFVQSLYKFISKHNSLPAPQNEDHAKEILESAKELNHEIPETARYNEESWLKHSPIITRLAKTASGQLCPMAAIFGGIIAQEVIKATSQKFTPLNQFFFLENLEALHEDPSPEDAKPRGSRYDGQIAVFGHKFNELLRDLRYFVVGAGAIGCEMLKNFAMIGIGSGPNGHISVTDMDTIEISNLNRQFLFRPWDVTKMKSDTAVNAAKRMNPDLNITSSSTRVGPDTEEVFNDSFWDKISGVANALDNVPARLYVDKRCVFYKKPLLESGTLASKGNVQVVVPDLTESYGSSTDPPIKETPICLLHSFPNNIEHCLQWAREDLFEGQFVKNPEIVNNYLEKQKYLESLSANLKYPSLEVLREYLLSREKTFDECIKWARTLFEARYNWRHRQLLFNFPADHVDSNGAPFWSGAKRPPIIIEYDANNSAHLEFVVSATFLRAHTLAITESELKPEDYHSKIEHIKKISAQIKLPEWKPKQGIKIVTDEKVVKEQEREMGDDEDQQIAEILSKLPTPSTVKWRTKVLKFEKDDDKNFHIDFINAASNLRAIAYSIKPVTRLQSKIIAGRIIPAMITTTAVVTGLVCIELYKLFQPKPSLGKLRNAFINLALPLFQQSEPIAPTTRKFLNKEFTLWDRINIKKGDLTLAELLKVIKEEHHIEVDMIGVGSALVYSSFGTKGKDRLPRKVSELVPEVAKIELKPHQRYFQLEITGSDKDGNDIEDNPDVFYWFK